MTDNTESIIEILQCVEEKMIKGRSLESALHSMLRPSNEDSPRYAQAIIKALKGDFEEHIEEEDFEALELEEQEVLLERIETIKKSGLTITQNKTTADKQAKRNKTVLYIPQTVLTHSIQPIGLSLKEGFKAVKVDVLRTSNDIKKYGLRTAGISLSKPTLIVPKVSAIKDREHDKFASTLLIAADELRKRIRSDVVIDLNLLRGFELLCRTRDTARKIESIIMDNGFAIFGMMDYPTIRNFITTALNISMPAMNFTLGRAVSGALCKGSKDNDHYRGFFKHWINWFSGLGNDPILRKSFDKQFEIIWQLNQDLWLQSDDGKEYLAKKTLKASQTA